MFSASAYNYLYIYMLFYSYTFTWSFAVLKSESAIHFVGVRYVCVL
jgi:hypothetical protein